MNRVEMMDALTGFNAALKAGAIKVQPTATDPKVFIHADSPEGTPRLSYVRMKGAHATAVAVVVITEPLENLPVIHIGCAVREDQRGKGAASSRQRHEEAQEGSSLKKRLKTINIS